MPILGPDADLEPLLEFLRAEPMLNSVPLGLVARAMTDPEVRSRTFAATIEHDGRIVAAAVRSEFPKMAIHGRGTAADHAALAGEVVAAMPDLPCVIGVRPVAEAFAGEWRRRTGRAPREGMRQRLHRLGELRPPEGVPGRMRAAETADVEVVTSWLEAFEIEASPATARPARELRPMVGRMIDVGAFLLWVDRPEGEEAETPVSLAGARETGERVARIGPVYTPPARRRRGYAGALTAAASRHMLDAGCHACCLFTDLDNPTSNHIYAEIGFLPVVEFAEFWLDGAS
jgi:GNAT superfamily N-acetyltransferase